MRHLVWQRGRRAVLQACSPLIMRPLTGVRILLQTAHPLCARWHAPPLYVYSCLCAGQRCAVVRSRAVSPSRTHPSDGT